MRITLGNNVFIEAKDRIKYLYDEFDVVVCGFSGGKDSTVCLNLCLEEARRRGRLPLPVMFIDQEAEWKNTIDYVKDVMYSDEVEPYWLQMEIKIFNATSHTKEWLYCWREGDKWIREKDPISIKENVYGTDRFKEVFGKFLRHHFGGQKACFVGGVRSEESPARFVSLTSLAKYKGITWGLGYGGNLYGFYPIYDWTYTDVWKAIHDHKWQYNKVYDYFYNYGVGVKNMRVSNLHHETAVHALYQLQEIEPETWNALTKRLEGVDTTAKIAKADNFSAPQELPFMFKDWREYRDYLLENLVEEETTKEMFRKRFEAMDKRYIGMDSIDRMYRVQITSILANDHYFTKLDNFEVSPLVNKYRRSLQGNVFTSEKVIYLK